MPVNLVNLDDKQMDYTYPSRGNFVLVASWFGASLTGLVFASVFLLYLSNPQVSLPQSSTYQLYQALPQTQTKTQDNISYLDGRGKAIENFFKGYKSNLATEANLFIQVSDKYQLDWRLLPAIAMQESNGGKRLIRNSFNPFGFGVYGSRAVKFESWEEAIEKVGKSLRFDYLDQGLHTPEEIMTKYTPPSIAKGGTWAKGIRSFMEELR